MHTIKLTLVPLKQSKHRIKKQWWRSLSIQFLRSVMHKQCNNLCASSHHPQTTFVIYKTSDKMYDELWIQNFNVDRIIRYVLTAPAENATMQWKKGKNMLFVIKSNWFITQFNNRLNNPVFLICRSQCDYNLDFRFHAIIKRRLILFHFFSTFVLINALR